MINTAEVSLARLGLLVSDLLDASRLQAGVLAVSLEPVAVDEILELVASDLDVPFEVLSTDAPDLLADPVLLKRVLANLIANAHQHAGSTPHVAVTRDGPTVALAVIDSGPGIAAELRDSVFEPFQREGDIASTGIGIGLGLGLALSRGFTEAMGGGLTASETVGGGLTMTVVLPVAP